MNENSKSGTDITDQHDKQNALLKNIRAKLHTWTPGVVKFTGNFAFLLLWILCVVSLAFCIYRFFAASSLKIWDALALAGVLIPTLIMYGVTDFKQKNKEFRSKMENRHPVLTHPGQWQLLPSILVISGVSLFLLVAAWHAWAWADLKNSSDRTTASLAVVGGLGLMVSLVVAYRKQSSNERNEAQREFATASQLLSSEQATTRIAGVYSLKSLGVRYQPLRHQVIDLLCAYLRTTRQDDAPVESFIILQFSQLLSVENPDRWKNIDLNLHGAILNEPLQLSTCTLSELNCDHAIFNEKVTLEKCNIAEQLSCEHTKFKKNFTLRDSCIAEHATGDEHGESTSFHDCEFASTASFAKTRFFGDVDFTDVLFSSCIIENDDLSPERVISDFWFAQFHGEADFTGAQFFGNARFIGAAFHSLATFNEALFLGSFKANNVTFPNSSETTVSFLNSHFHGDASLRIIQFPDTLWLVNCCFCQDLDLTGSTVPSKFETGGLEFRKPTDIDFVRIDNFTIRDIQAKQAFHKQLKANGYI